MNIFVIFAVCAFLSALSICIFVFLKGHKSPIRNAFIPIAFLAGFWCLFPAAAALSSSPKVTLFLARLVYISALFTGPAFLTFGITMAEAEKKKFERKLIHLSYIIGVLFLPLLFSPLLIKGVLKYQPHFSLVVGPLYPIFIVFFAATCLYSFYRLALAFRTAVGQRKNQIKYIFIAYVFAFLSAVVHFGSAYGLREIFPHDILVVTCMALLAYAVITYRLVDINVAMMSVAIFTVVYALVLGVPFGLAGWFRAELTAVFGENWFWLPMVLLLGLATLGPSIFIFLQKKAKNEILKDKNRNHAILLADAQHMPLVHDREKLCDSIVNMPPEILDSAFATIYLFDREKKVYSFCVTKYGRKRNIKIEQGNLLVKYLINVKKPAILEELKREYDRKHDVFMKEVLNTMNKLNADVVVPFIIEEELIGFLILGFKKSGEIYSTDDLNVLANLAGQAALAIENAQFLKEREEMQVKLREEQTLKAIGDLAGIVSHEMGNILNKVSQRVQTMMRGGNSDPEKFKESLENMDGNIASAKSIWSSINEYKEKTLANVISIHPLAEDISRAFNHSKKLMDAWKIKTSVSFINSRITIIGIGTMPDIFKHLVINSAYGMETTGGEITYSAKVMQDKGTIEIIQEDTGSGLAGDIANHKTCGGELFAEQGKQGGVSFYIAKQIIYDHKGSLELQSNNGKGTRFVIRLPLDFTKVSV